MSREIRILKEIRFVLEYAGVRIMLWTATLLPLRFTSACGATLGWLAWEVIRMRRAVAIDNIRQALGVDAARAAAIGGASYRNTGRSLMEFAAFGKLTPDDIRRIVRMEGLELVDSAHGSGSGVMICVGHYGSWDLFGASMGASGYPFCGIAGKQSNPYVDRLINELRGRHINLLPAESRARTIIRSLRRGDIVGIVADQDAGPRGVFVDFLGRRASAHAGPASFAALLGCPLLFASINRLPGPRFEVRFSGPFWPDGGLEADTTVAQLTQRFHDELAHAIRRHPEEYFWGHRRWKTRPPDEHN